MHLSFFGSLLSRDSRWDLIKSFNLLLVNFEYTSLIVRVDINFSLIIDKSVFETSFVNLNLWENSDGSSRTNSLKTYVLGKTYLWWNQRVLLPVSAYKKTDDVPSNFHQLECKSRFFQMLIFVLPIKFIKKICLLAQEAKNNKINRNTNKRASKNFLRATLLTIGTIPLRGACTLLKGAFVFSLF